MVEGGGDVMVSKSSDMVTTKTAPKKNTVRVDRGKEATASGRGEESLDRSVLKGMQGKGFLPL